MKAWAKGLVAALAIVVVVLGVLLWQQRRDPPPPVATAEPKPVQLVPSDEAASAPVPAVQFPVAADDAASQPVAALPSGDQVDAAVETALSELVGRKAVLSHLQVDGFVRRLVATVDNLDRTHAPARVWPVNPTPGQFMAAGEDEKQAIAPDNALRYSPFVQFVESIDAARAVALYRWLYPLFQRSYEELGYPGRYFNDRLVGVIDHLLQTPAPAVPIAITLTEIKGPIPSARPWVHYQYADPALEARSAGQKILMRMGPVNERRLKARLQEFRRLLATPPPQK